MAQIGRNDPCYCGSGKKYKQCHLKIDQQKEKEKRDWQRAATFLRRNLPIFARDEQFAVDFAAALPLYWNGLYDHENAEEMSQPEALRFFDWFMFDYTLENGRRLIDIYREQKWDDLAEPQQKVLTAWLEAGSAWGYTLLDYDGPTLKLADFLTGEEVEVFEPGGHGLVQKGEIILTRLVAVADRLEFSTSAAYLPQDEIGDIAEKMKAEREAYLAEHPEADETAFRRARNHLLVHHALVQAEQKGRPPVARLDPNRPDKKMQKVVQKISKRKR